MSAILNETSPLPLSMVNHHMSYVEFTVNSNSTCLYAVNNSNIM